MEKSGFRKTSPRDLGVLLLLVTMVLWFTDEIVRGGKVPFFRDLGPYFYPMRFNLAMSFQSGELPLWNSHVAMGFPLAANFQSGAFYPPHLLFLILPFFDAIRFLFVFHCLVAATGSYILCRQWNYPRYLSLIGSILFTFGGMIVSLGNLLDHFQTAVWLPWVLLLGERSLHSPSWKNFLLFSSVLLVQFLAGSPEIYAMSLGLFFLDGLRFRAEGADITYRRLLSLLFAANTLVAGLAMVQILPTIELLLQSWRSETIPYANVTAWSLYPLSLLNLFFLDKEVNVDAFHGLHLYFSQERPLLTSLYLGAIALPGICLWFFTSSFKEKTALLGLVIISVTLAMGSHTPVYPFLFKYFPPLGLVRFPEKFFFITFAVVLFITLTGLFRFLSLDRSLHRRALLALSSLPILIFLLPYLFLQLNMDALIQLIAWAGRSAPNDGSTLQISAAVPVNLERQILLTFGIFLLLALWKVGKLQSTLFGVLLVALTFFDLSSAHRSYQFPLDPHLVFKKPRVINTPDKEPYRLFYNHNLSYLHPNYYRFSPRAYAEKVSSVFANLIPNTGVFHGFDYMQELDALGRKPYNLFLKVAHKLPPERLYRFLGALNVKYINSFQSLPKGGITLIRHFPQYPSWLYRIDHAIPRSYIVPKVIVEGDPLETLDRLSSTEFDPLKEVVLGQTLPMPPNKDFRSEAKIVRYTNHHVTVQTTLNGQGILVLADSFYPGWRVYVDGNESKILRANFFFRGVRLTAGNHLVEFRYQPYWFKLGLFLSLSMVSFVLLFILFNCFGKVRQLQGWLSGHL